MIPEKEKALETIGSYIESASDDERNKLLIWLEGFAYHAQCVDESAKTDKPA